MVELYFDGTVRPSNDEAAVGLFSKNSEGEVTEKMYQIQAINNHEAEFIAFAKAVEWAHELIAQGESVISFRTDSEAVALAVEREFVKNKRTQTIFDPAFTLSTLTTRFREVDSTVGEQSRSCRTRGVTIIRSMIHNKHPYPHGRGVCSCSMRSIKIWSTRRPSKSTTSNRYGPISTVLPREGTSPNVYRIKPATV